MAEAQAARCPVPGQGAAATVDMKAKAPAGSPGAKAKGQREEHTRVCSVAALGAFLPALPTRAYKLFACATGARRAGKDSSDSKRWKSGAGGAGSEIKADTRQSGVAAVCIPIDLEA